MRRGSAGRRAGSIPRCRVRRIRPEGHPARVARRTRLALFAIVAVFLPAVIGTHSALPQNMPLGFLSTSSRGDCIRAGVVEKPCTAFAGPSHVLGREATVLRCSALSGRREDIRPQARQPQDHPRTFPPQLAPGRPERGKTAARGVHVGRLLPQSMGVKAAIEDYLVEKAKNRPSRTVES